MRQKYAMPPPGGDGSGGIAVKKGLYRAGGDAMGTGIRYTEACARHVAELECMTSGGTALLKAHREEKSPATQHCRAGTHCRQGAEPQSSAVFAMAGTVILNNAAIINTAVKK